MYIWTYSWLEEPEEHEIETEFS